MNKVCVVTGGTGGLGYFIAEGFYKAGYTVVALDVVKHKENKAIHYIQTDLRSKEAIAQAFQAIHKQYGGIHVLINNGAIAYMCVPIQELDIEDFDDLIQVNLRGSVLCAKAFIAYNKDESYGRIINIASTRWYQNEAHWEAYGASKGALVSFTHTLAVSLAETPITVNAVSPGWIQVDDYHTLSENDHKQHPSGRVGKPQDIVNACLFLADEGNDFINGHNLVVDGGMTKKMIYEP